MCQTPSKAQRDEQTDTWNRIWRILAKMGHMVAVLLQYYLMIFLIISWPNFVPILLVDPGFYPPPKFLWSMAPRSSFDRLFIRWSLTLYLASRLGWRCYLARRAYPVSESYDYEETWYVALERRGREKRLCQQINTERQWRSQEFAAGVRKVVRFDSGRHFYVQTKITKKSGTKKHVFSWQYAPYAPCTSTPLHRGWSKSNTTNLSVNCFISY